MPSVVVTLVLLVAAAVLVRCSCSCLVRAAAALAPVRETVDHSVRVERVSLDASLAEIRDRSIRGDGG